MRISNYTILMYLLKKMMLLYFPLKLYQEMKKTYKLHNQLVKDGIEVISEDSEFIHVSVIQIGKI